MTDQEIAELERLEREATSAPWEFMKKYGNSEEDWIAAPGQVGKYGENLAVICGNSSETITIKEADAGLIVAVRNALPRLLAERRALVELEAYARKVWPTSELDVLLAAIDRAREAKGDAR
jgi:hypothetical protein